MNIDYVCYVAFYKYLKAFEEEGFGRPQDPWVMTAGLYCNKKKRCQNRNA